MPVCTATQSNGVTDTSSSLCSCGTHGGNPTTPTNKYCALNAHGFGSVFPNPVCTPAQSDGRTNNGATADICNCGSTVVTPTTATMPYCALTPLAGGEVLGMVLPNPVCTTTQSNGVTDTSSSLCNCGSRLKPTTSWNKYCALNAHGFGMVFPNPL